ncbi:hypothetical protein GCM10023220_70340 [Streptomyces ziwulingensis]|uniref:Uncharacterized protein n=1 Tax=Streptomyces ziwulingensis TaxID=1045501 RepID=A0ABP9D2R3_9ACTN
MKAPPPRERCRAGSGRRVRRVEVGDFAEHTQGAVDELNEAGFGKYDED